MKLPAGTRAALRRAGRRTRWEQLRRRRGVARSVRLPALLRPRGRVRRAQVTRFARPVASCLLLAGGTVLAFFSGGFFDQPRLVAALCAWLLVVGSGPERRAAAAAVAARPAGAWRAGGSHRADGRLDRVGAARRARHSTTPSARSCTSAPSLAGVAFLRADRFIEPALAGGALLVVLYGLSERLPPRPGGPRPEPDRRRAARTADHLLERHGGVAAMGLVLCARMAADERRPIGARGRRRGGAARRRHLPDFSRGAIAAAGRRPARPRAPATRTGGASAGSRRRARHRPGSGSCLRASFPGCARSSEGGLSDGLQGVMALVLLLALAAAAAGSRSGGLRHTWRHVPPSPARGRGRSRRRPS